MPDLLAAHAEQRPDRAALITEEGRTVTYAQLNARANRCAHALRGLGMGRGDRCVHLHHNGVEGFELGNALRKLQAVSTPVNTRLRGAEVAYILEDSGAQVVVAGPEFTAVIDEARGLLAGRARSWVALGDGAPPGWVAYEDLLGAAPASEPEGSDDAVMAPAMVYTAGTTGNPKGAIRPTGPDPLIIMQYLSTFRLSPDDVHLLAGPGYHSAPAVFAGLQILLGATTVIMRRFDAEQALRLIDRHRVTSTFMAPILVKRILDLPEEVRARYDVSSLRALVVAAAPFPADVKQRAVEYFGPCVYEFYGATETGIVTAIGPSELLRRPNSCGRPLDGVEVRLLDDAGAPVATGQPGELWVRSGAMFDQYLNRPEATRQSYRDGFFTVGDIAYADGEGYIHICDRKVDMIITGGVNVYPAEVEAVLMSHAGVADCTVVGIPDSEWGEAVVAVVVPREPRAVTADDLIALCRSRLAAYKCPRHVDLVDELPRDAAGKLLKRLVRDRYWEAAGRRV